MKKKLVRKRFVFGFHFIDETTGGGKKGRVSHQIDWKIMEEAAGGITFRVLAKVPRLTPKFNFESHTLRKINANAKNAPDEAFPNPLIAFFLLVPTLRLSHRNARRGASKSIAQRVLRCQEGKMKRKLVWRRWRSEHFSHSHRSIKLNFPCLSCR
jgi:hypothetical protein